MRFLIVTPAKRGSTKGNRITADRWASILKLLGHQVVVETSDVPGNHDALIALHARRSAKHVDSFKARNPGRPVIVAMTGTDLHHDLHRNPIVVSTLNRCDQIVLLEPNGQRRIPSSIQQKANVILQSAKTLKTIPAKLKRIFEISVLGHLRPVKDPFRTAMAARRLPETSRIRVVHFGHALSESMRQRALKEMENNPRYRWLGPVSHGQAVRRLARSQATVLSSRAEGGSSVIAEAIVNHVPVMAARNDASIGQLGDRHPGLFDFGDTKSLAKMLARFEESSAYRAELRAAGDALARRFSPSEERRAWQRLIEKL